MSEGIARSREIYRRHRPRGLDDLVGQADAVRVLKGLLRDGRMPHALLLSGPSGVGKTTIARILQGEMGCRDDDFHNVDCPSLDGALAAVRDIRQAIRYGPKAGGRCRIWFLEEAQALSKTPFAQQAMLQLLEDPPDHAYFMLATTDPGKLLAAVRTRCLHVPLSALSGKALRRIVDGAAAAEGREVEPSVLARIVEAAAGSARAALQLLHKALSVDGEADRLSAIQLEGAEAVAIDLVKALLWEKVDWPKVAALLEGLDEDPEQVRRLVLANASKAVLRGDKKAHRAFLTLTAFEGSFYDSGKAGLVRACWEVAQGR